MIHYEGHTSYVSLSERLIGLFSDCPYCPIREERDQRPLSLLFVYKRVLTLLLDCLVPKGILCAFGCLSDLGSDVSDLRSRQIGRLGCPI